MEIPEIPQWLGGAIIGGIVVFLVQRHLQKKEFKHQLELQRREFEKKRNLKKDEIIAGKKVKANQEAYVRIKKVESLIVAKFVLTEASNYIDKQEKWLFNNRLFLPGRFPDKWLLIRNNIFVYKLLISELKKLDALREIDRKKILLQKSNELKKKLSTLVKEAIDEIYKDTGHERLLSS
ncbi:MAG: hypothetical protein ACE5K0_08985 [Candidatus Methanofastidiosia archaeon]